MTLVNQKAEDRATVLQVLPALKTGGAERTAVDIAHALEDAGWGSVVASEGGPLVADLPEGTRHKVLRLNTRNPIRMYRNVTHLARLIDKTGADIVHARSRGPAWSAMLAARRMGVPFVTTYHGAYSEQNRLKALYNSVMARADAVIANSHWTAALVAKRYPWARESIIPVPRGTDFKLFDPAIVPADKRAGQRRQWKVNEDDFVFVHLARMGSWKGQEVVIDALAKLKDVVPRLVVVLAGAPAGKGDFDRKLRARIAKAGLADRVVLPGYCNQPNLALAAGDCAIVASVRAEAFGRAAVEAGAMERPVIATDLGAVVETIVATPDDARTGWLVAPSDAGQLADAMRAVAALSHEARAAIGKRGRQRGMALFSIETMQASTLDIYRDVLERKARESQANRV